jgi:hypothetical protein
MKALPLILGTSTFLALFLHFVVEVEGDTEDVDTDQPDVSRASKFLLLNTYISLGSDSE